MTSRANKISHQVKKDSIKYRKNARKRRKKALKKAKRRIRRPKRNLLSGKHFYALEAFIRFLHKFLKNHPSPLNKSRAYHEASTNEVVAKAWRVLVAMRRARTPRGVAEPATTANDAPGARTVSNWVRNCT